MSKSSELSRSTSGILEEMTIDDVRKFNPEVVVLPIGSTEPHGPHLPYGTDFFQVDAMSRAGVKKANARGGRVLMYPTLPISNNVNVKAFPFVCRIGIRTLMNVVLDIVEALEEDGIRKVVLMNGHGGNPDTLQATIREQVGRRRAGEGAFVCMLSTFGVVPAEVLRLIEHPSDHAGESETSMVMHVRPDLVREDKLGDFPRGQAQMAKLREGKAFFVRPWDGYLPVSAGGETRKSSAEKGRAMLEAGSDWLADFLVELTEAPWGVNFPYKPPQ